MLKPLPKALFSAALLASLACMPASYAQAPSTPAVKAAAADNTTRMKLEPGADTVKVRAVYSPNVRPNPPSADEFDSSESGWRSYGMLLATLVLMGVIAVRRYKAERH
ncbi:hypothetical protein SAMN05216350_109156 [Polaromonas sp. YR568]|uniref:hypothetical protein n=1 Tax=Polaromonas sp. YR568 TaxID=1855301 RepID=UPI0008E48A62|nr:hypothetical protein [Polaromonas sp. YR568]SFU95503.1 hypothetical protein SAMN05216350_109156 [Polaromonas sp. YR568]